MNKLLPIHPRAQKKIFLYDRYCVDGEDATQMINTNHTMAAKESFVDQLPAVICYEGIEGLNKAFLEWIQESKQVKRK